MTESNNPPELIVACLCAAWCHVCNDYQATFNTLAAEYGGKARFVWVDIEDEELAMGDIDIDDFPTLMLASGNHVHFLGAVTPHGQTARNLIGRAMLDELGSDTSQDHASLLKHLNSQ